MAVAGSAIARDNTSASACADALRQSFQAPGPQAEPSHRPSRRGCGPPSLRLELPPRCCYPLEYARVGCLARELAIRARHNQLARRSVGLAKRACVTVRAVSAPRQCLRNFSLLSHDKDVRYLRHLDVGWQARFTSRRRKGKAVVIQHISLLANRTFAALAQKSTRFTTGN